MKISVIVPTFERRKSLEALLNSLSVQTYKNFNVIIVNNNPGGSGNDFIQGIVSKFHDLHCAIVTSGKNLGAGGGRNFGAMCSETENSEILAFIDDDCLATPNWLEVIGSCFSQKDGQKGDKIIYGKVTSDLPPMRPIIHGFDMKGGVFGSGNCAILKDFFFQLGGFDTYLNNWAEDFEIGERCRKFEVTPTYIDKLIVNHPPKIIPYTFHAHILKKSFYKKFLYIIKIRNYEYKSRMQYDYFVNGLKKGLIVILAITLAMIFHPVFLILPFLINGIFQFPKMMKIYTKAKNYPWPEGKISIPNLIKYMLFSWIIDIANFFIITFLLIPFNQLRIVNSIYVELRSADILNGASFFSPK